MRLTYQRVNSILYYIGGLLQLLALVMLLPLIVREPSFPAACVFMAVYNHEEDSFSLVRGSHSIHAQDEIFLTASTSEIGKVVDRLTAGSHR